VILNFLPPTHGARRARELKEYFEKKWEHVRDGIVEII
jgi:hypothetical protein